MKKVISFLMAFIFVLSFAACGKQNTIEDTKVFPENETEAIGTALGEYVSGKELSDNFYDCQIKIKNTVYQFPMSVKDFEKSGAFVATKYDDPNMIVPSQHTKMVRYAFSDGSLVFVRVANFSKSEMPLKDIHVVGIMCDLQYCDYHIDPSCITIAKGITLTKSTKEDVIAAYGEPQRQYENEEHTVAYFTYERRENSAYQCLKLEINLEQNIVINIEMENEKIPTDIVEKPISQESISIEKEYKVPLNLGTDILSGTYELDGDLYRLPTPMSAFLENGWQMDGVENTVIPAKSGVFLMLKRNGKKLSNIYVFNPTENAIPVENGVLYKITSYSLMQHEAFVAFPANIEAMAPASLLNGYELQYENSDFILENNQYKLYGRIEDDKISYVTLNYKR